MRLINLSILRFGGLENFELRFEDGLQMVYGPNESGKSSILAFIRAMLYGFGRNSKDPEKSDRLRYRPWQSSEDFGGTMRFEHNGVTYRLERFFAGRRAQDRIGLWDEERMTQVRLSNPHAPGEELLGLSEAEFVASCLIEKATDHVKDSGLEGKIASLSGSGDENTDAEEMDRRLKKAERYLTGGPDGGALGRALEEERRLTAELEAALNRDSARMESLHRIEQLERYIAETEQHIQIYFLHRDLQEANQTVEKWQSYLGKKQRWQRIKEGQDDFEAGDIAMQAVPVRELTALSQQRQKYLTARQQGERIEAEIQQLRQRETYLKHHLEEISHHKRELLTKQRSLDERLQHLRSKGEHHRRLDAEFSARPALAAAALTGGVCLLLTLVLFILKTWAAYITLASSFIIPLVILGIYMRNDEKARRARQREDNILRRHEVEAGNLRNAMQELKWQSDNTEEQLREAAANLEDRRSARETAVRLAEREKRQLVLALKPWFKVWPEQTAPEEMVEMLRDYSLAGEQRVRLMEGELSQMAGLLDERQEEAMRVSFEQASAKIRRLRESLRTLGASEESDSEDLHLLRERQIKLREQLAVERNERAALDRDTLDTANLERQLKLAFEKRSRLEEHSAATAVARGILSQAREQFEREARPLLHKEARRWLEELTLGKYKNVRIDSEWNIHLEAPDDRRFHEDIYYSAGTRDLIWLSLRLASASILSDAQGALPVYLDDSLRQIDSERVKRCLEVFSEYTAEKGNQMVLFSSSDEQAGIAHDLGIPIFRMHGGRADAPVPAGHID